MGGSEPSLRADSLEIVHGQLVEAGDDAVGLLELGGFVGIRHGDSVHAGGLGGLEAPVRVLDDDAALRGDGFRPHLLELLQGQQEALGIMGTHPILRQDDIGNTQ
jgi:hypothetical protein